MRPCKLRRHIETKHPSLVTKPREFFERKLKELCTQKKTIETFSTVNAKATEASYRVALRIAKTGKPHNIGETLLLPAAKDMCSVMMGEAAAAKLNVIQLSDNTIQRRISDMGADVRQQVVDSVRESPSFSLQLDESTDVANCAQLMVYVRFVKELNVHEEFLFCHPLPSRTTADEIFKVLNDFMRENNVDWGRCCGICTDGARAMTGRHSGLVKKVQEVAPAAIWTHCIIHRQALATKRMPQELHTVLDEAVKIVNLIKSRAMNARVFSILCKEMGAHFKQLLLHSEVRWLSRGKVLTRLCDLREEVLLFLAEINSPLVKHMEDMKWVAKLAYLSDVFEKINTLNICLQGKECNVFYAHDQLCGFRKKLELWGARVERGSVEMFPTLEDVLARAELKVECLQQVVCAHLEGMRKQFGEYFGEETMANQWVRNPFSFPVTLKDGLSAGEEEALAELSCDMDLKQRMSDVSLAHFWLSVGTEFPQLSTKAVNVLIPFTSTYLCECGFSALAKIKSKYRSRLLVEDDLRLYLSSVQPRITQICASKAQAHCSH
ncbi:zinc finger BED domain-containing protein 5-like [Etheostoma spectabile]|uniref:zinc finger BED domain-containing protein 5-like n=2 Tax=Etheostoma spectabile TaxID=54343 RepID=UPI0013AECE54|nr:zinc finger BED domain-containing protein 5-like [Etheostoma spectabile]